jgi:hypothetical protein
VETQRIARQGMTYSALLRVVIFPSAVEIGDNALEYCGNLETVILGSSIRSLGSSAFSNCQNLKSIPLPNSLRVVEYLCFAYCTALTEVLLPGGLGILGDSAFSASGLVNLSIPGGTWDISVSALSDALSLRTVLIRGSVSHALCEALSRSPVKSSLIIYVQEDYNANGVSLCNGKFIGWTGPPNRTLHPSKPVGIPSQTAQLQTSTGRDPTTPTSDYHPFTPVSTIDIERAIEAKPDTKIRIDDIPPGAPVTITGEGDTTSIVGVSNAGPVALHFANLTVKGKEITIADLHVDSYLELHEGVILKPPDGQSILLLSEVEIRLVSSTIGKLPLLDIGVTAMNVVPRAILVDIDEAIVGNARRLVIKGRPFDSCDGWRNALRGLPGDVKGECQTVTSGRTLAAGERGLYLVRKLADKGGGSRIPIIAGVIGAVVVIIAIVVGYLMWRNSNRGRRHSSSASPSV